MSYSVTISWGRNFPKRKKMEFRVNLASALEDLGVLPCWKERNARFMPWKRKQNSYLFVDQYQIFKFNEAEKSPAAQHLIERLKNRTQFSKARFLWDNALNVTTGILVALFPKCPVCWATYMSLFGMYEFNQIVYPPRFYYFLIGIALTNLAYTAYVTLRKNNVVPLVIQLTGYLALIFNRYFVNEKLVISFGVTMLISSSLALHLDYNRIINIFKKLSI